jgi:hypothetical protein
VAEVINAAGKEEVMGVAAATRQPRGKALSSFRHDLELYGFASLLLDDG